MARTDKAREVTLLGARQARRDSPAGAEGLAAGSGSCAGARVDTVADRTPAYDEIHAPPDERSSGMLESAQHEAAAALLVTIIEGSDDAIISKTLDGVITSWNAAAQRIFGYRAAEAMGRPITLIIPEDRLDEEPRIIERLKRGERVDHLETKRTRKDGSFVDISLTISPVRDATGEIIGASKIARDITERKRAEKALREREELFRGMIDVLPAAIYTTDAEGRLTHFNPAAAEFSGRIPELGTDKWCVSWKLHNPDGTPLPHDECPMAVALKQGHPVHGAEAILERPDGERRWFMPFPTPLYDDEGRLVGGINMLVDITERKQAEATLRESEERQRFLLKLSDALRPLVDPATIQIEAMRVLIEKIDMQLAQYWELDPRDNEYFLSAGAYAPNAEPLPQRLRPNDFGRFVQATLFAGHTIIIDDTQADPRLDADERKAHAAADIGSCIGIPLMKEGRFVAGLGIYHPVPHAWTEHEIALTAEVAERTWDAIQRARAEQALTASEEKYRSLFDAMDEGYCIIEVLFDDQQQPVDYRFMEVNDSFERQAGMHDVVGKRMLEFVPVIEPHWLQNYGQVARTGEGARFTGEFKGLHRWFDVYAFRAAGWPRHHVAVTFADVTRHTETEAALRQSEGRLRLAQMAGNIGTTDYDVATDQMLCSPDFYAMYGLPLGAGVTLATLLATVHPEDRESVEGGLRESIDGGVHFADEFRILRADDGRERWIAKRALAIQMHDDSRHLIGADIDVTDRRQAEEAARSGEIRMRALFNQAAVGVFETGPAGHLVMVNDRWCAMLGYSEAELLGRDTLDFVDPDFRDDFERRLASLSTSNPDFEADICFRCNDGEGMFVTLAVSALHRPDNVVLCMVGVALDITERNRMENALRESEDRLQQALDAGSMGTFVWYPELDRIVDNGMFDLLGLDGDTTLCMQELVRDCVHTDDAGSFSAALERACDPAGDGIFKKDFRFVHGAGHVCWLAVSGQVRFEGDPPYAWYMSGVLADITAEKRAESSLHELNENLEELVAERTRELVSSEQRVRTTASKLARAEQAERRRISQILHDDLQQQLHGMQMKLGMMRRRINDGDLDGAMHSLDEVQRWAGEGVQIARQLTTDLSPPIMKSEGLIETLGWLVGEMRDKHDLEVEMVGDRSVELGDDDLRVLLFQIVRELLFNVVKHAGTDQARIEVEQLDAHLVVRVRDSGRGFASSADVAPKADGGFGLFSARERLALFGASMEVDSGPAAGTCITLKVPMSDDGRAAAVVQDTRSE